MFEDSERSVEETTQLQAEAQYEIDENTALSELKAEDKKVEKKRKFLKMPEKKDKRDEEEEEKKGFFNNSFVIAFIAAVLLNLFIETVSRQSTPFIGGFMYMIQQPLVFLANTLIIYATLSICAFFRRRTFVLCLVSSLWIALGISNAVTPQSYRSA